MAFEQVTPPGDIAGHIAAPSEALASRESFFFAGREGLIKTPTDELTGLPLPVIPVDHPQNADWHHHFHPKRSSILKNDDGGKALRNARLQRVDYAVHHYGYHHNYGGPELPATDERKFTLVIMAVAGYMPEFGLHFPKDKSRIGRLSPDMRQRLQTSGEIRVGSVDPIRRFLRGYLLQQDITLINVNELTLEEFITTSNTERQRLLGHTLLGLITEKATEHVDEIYYQARRKELLMPGVARSVEKFTKTTLGPLKSRDRLVQELHSSLAA